jgi:D-alanyl-D-alanine carboxypeptidase/D-alanyl-D-alanine-endopeptidase (penicillin-binding protein 4)
MDGLTVSLMVSLQKCLAFVLIGSFTPVLGNASPLQRPDSAAAQQRDLAVDSLESLRARIAGHIAQPRFARAAWGAKVVSLVTGKVVFEHDAGRYFNPASNAKLYTAALALDALGDDFRIKTSLYAASGPDRTGRLAGDLLLYGRGDPSIAASFNGGDYYAALEPFAQSLAAAGVRRIDGDLIGDESYFRGPPLGAGWGWTDLQWYYGAETSALSINDNALDLFVKPAAKTGIPCRISTGPATPLVTVINRTRTAELGSKRSIGIYRPLGENVIYISGRMPIDDPGYTVHVAVHKPASLFVEMLKQVLERHGIAIKGKAYSVDWLYREVTPVDLSRLVEVGSVYSRPMRDIVRLMLKVSQNLYAELLLLQVGASRAAGAGALNAAGGGRAQVADQNGAEARELTTEQEGIEQMNLFLSKAIKDERGALLEEGSGLSRRDIVTPASMVALLAFMTRHRLADVFRESLPVAGGDGTLQNRMKGTAGAGNIRAKTGTLQYVNALSGYLTTAAGEQLAFSIMLNNYSSDGSTSPRDDIDEITLMLASFRGHT